MLKIVVLHSVSHHLRKLSSFLPFGQLCFSACDRPEGHRLVGMGPEEATKMIRGLEHLSYEEWLRVGAVEPGEEKALGRLYCGLPVPEGGLQDSCRETF